MLIHLILLFDSVFMYLLFILTYYFIIVYHELRSVQGVWELQAHGYQLPKRCYYFIFLNKTLITQVVGYSSVSVMADIVLNPSRFDDIPERPIRQNGIFSLMLSYFLSPLFLFLSLFFSPQCIFRLSFPEFYIILKLKLSLL